MSERGKAWVFVIIPLVVLFWASIIRLVAHLLGRYGER